MTTDDYREGVSIMSIVMIVRDNNSHSTVFMCTYIQSEIEIGIDICKYLFTHAKNR